MSEKSESLNSILQKLVTIEGMLVESQGEITPEIESLLAVKEITLPEKVEGYAAVIERLKLVTEYYENKAELYAKISKATKLAGDRCKDNLKNAMDILGVKELKGVETKFKLSPSNPSVVISDESLIEGPYLITETVTKVDKRKIAEDLKLGVPVKGATLKENFSLRSSILRGDK